MFSFQQKIKNHWRKEYNSYTRKKEPEWFRCWAWGRLQSSCYNTSAAVSHACEVWEGTMILSQQTKDDGDYKKNQMPSRNKSHADIHSSTTQSGSQCPSADGKLSWPIHTAQYYWALKEGSTDTCFSADGLESMVLSERNVTKDLMLYDSTLMNYSKEADPETESGPLVRCGGHAYNSSYKKKKKIHCDGCRTLWIY